MIEVQLFALAYCVWGIVVVLVLYGKDMKCEIRRLNRRMKR